MPASHAVMYHLGTIAADHKAGGRGGLDYSSRWLVPEGIGSLCNISVTVFYPRSSGCCTRIGKGDSTRHPKMGYVTTNILHD